MNSEDAATDDDFVYCQECGAEIKRSAEICTECGVSQSEFSVSGQEPQGDPTPTAENSRGQQITEQTDDDFVYCQECGAEIKRSAEICNECGVRQKATSPSVVEQNTSPQPSTEQPKEQQTPIESSTSSKDYSIFQWLASIGVAILSFPIGLIVPVYLFYKTRNGTGKEQSGLEAWTAILFGIIGIISVEIGGKNAAKLLWGLSILIIGFSIAYIGI